jgi:hypothetical protein
MTSARLAATVALLTFAACNVSSDFQEPIAEFSTATGKAQTALTDLDSNAAKELTALRHADAIATPTRVSRVEGCTPQADRCIVSLGPDPAGDDQGGPLTVTSITPTYVQAMREISLYAKSLDDIVKADATGAVKTGLDKASAAAAQLASLAGKQYEVAVNAFSVPFNAAATWVFGQYQESIKLHALREATRRMQTVLPEAAAMFGDAADRAHLVAVTRLVDTFGDKQIDFATTASPANLDSYLDAAQRLDIALQVKPSEVFQQLNLAHHELAAALESDDITFGEAILQIDRLVTKVEQLVDIAQAFKKAADAH